MSQGALVIVSMLVAIGGLAAQETRHRNVGDAVSSTRPAEVSSLAREGQEALDRDDFQGAARSYEELVKLAPGTADFHLRLGIAYYSAGRPRDAVDPLKTTLKLNAGNTRARDYLAASLAESGQCSEAIPQLRKALLRVSDGTLKRATEVDGVRCAMTLNRTDDALDFLKLLNRDFPRDPEVLYLSTHVFSDLSIKASQDLLYAAPGSYQVHLLNAEALEAQGKWDEAAMEYRSVLERNPRLPGIHYRLGRLLLSQPKNPPPVEEARREFEEELKISPANAGAEYVLGELARQAGEWPQAIEHFSAAAKFDSGFADAFIGLGRSLIAAGRAAEAVAPLETGVKLQPENPAGHFHLATAYRRTGRKEEAAREAALHKQTSEKIRQTTDDIQKGIIGPQRAEP